MKKIKTENGFYYKGKLSEVAKHIKKRLKIIKYQKRRFL